MAVFTLLPTELVEFIACYLAQEDLYRLSQVNRSLNTLVIPYLYRHVDLMIHPGEKMPRVDRFCLNVLSDGRRAARVETLRLGPSSEDGVKASVGSLETDRSMTSPCTQRSRTLWSQSL
jgi:hypothetical protein